VSLACPLKMLRIKLETGNRGHWVPMHPGKSWIFPGFSRPWKVLDNQFGPRKLWEIKA